MILLSARKQKIEYCALGIFVSNAKSELKYERQEKKPLVTQLIMKQDPSLNLFPEIERKSL